MRTHIHLHTPTYTHQHTHTHKQRHIDAEDWRQHTRHECVNAHAHSHINIRTHTAFEHTHTHTHTPWHTHKRIHPHTCTHTHTHAHAGRHRAVQYRGFVLAGFSKLGKRGKNNRVSCHDNTHNVRNVCFNLKFYKRSQQIFTSTDLNSLQFSSFFLRATSIAVSTC